MKKLIIALVAIVVLIVVFLVIGPFFVLYEGQQAVVVRLGQIVAGVEALKRGVQHEHSRAGIEGAAQFGDRRAAEPGIDAARRDEAIPMVSRGAEDGVVALGVCHGDAAVHRGDHRAVHAR
ncbi:MAG TPA: hypothetical protein PKW82_04680, partial [Spirochaetales bacterium]|nr:hypothetical protein [Spirochaetales bacterium]